MTKKGGMTTAERIKALLTGERIDRVPVWLWVLSSDFAAAIAGCSVASLYSDAEKSFWAQVWTQEIFRSDDIPRLSFGGLSATFGGEVQLPTDKYDTGVKTTRYPVESEEDVWKLKLPQDMKATLPIPYHMQFARLQEKHDFPISVWCEAPLNVVGYLCGMERLCRWLIKRPEVVHHLLRLATEYNLQVVRYWAETFPPEHIIVLTVAPATSNSVISPKHFETFNLPYHKELNEKILAMGIKHIFCHICGNQTLNLSYWTQIPMGDPGIASFGHEVDLAVAIKYLGDTCIICGNIEPAIMLRGTPEQVYELSRQAIERAKHAPRGFILMPGCGVPSLVPLYNVYMLKKAASDFGWY